MNFKARFGGLSSSYERQSSLEVSAPVSDAGNFAEIIISGLAATGSCEFLVTA